MNPGSIMGSFWKLCTLFWVLLRSINAIELDVDDPNSIKNAAATAAYGMMSWYKGNLTGQTPGLLPSPYYWWEAGAMFMCLVDYWVVTGDASYNPEVIQGLLFQIGPYQDFMPPNQTADMGNDDQAFWAMAALSAAENNFPDPPAGKDSPSWLGLAQAVFNEQIARWDDSTCAGGLHWQAVTVNLGYNLKNTISNGSLMQIAARLARYLNDDMYADWATKLWDWMIHVKLIDMGDWGVYDNTDSNNNCTTVDKTSWTYNAGVLLAACATMYNYTEDAIWANRTQNLLDALAVNFFPDGIMTEHCEDPRWIKGCNPDQHSFKAYLARWMAATTQMAPFTYTKILGLLRSTAIAAAKQCDGGADGQQCGLKWHQNSTFDGDLGPGQQMAAMEVFLGTLVKSQKAPVTNTTGGTSTSHPDAGYNKSAVPPGMVFVPPKTKDKAGAWFLTALLSLGIMFGIWCLESDFWENERVEQVEKAGEKLQLSSDGKGKTVDRTSVVSNIDEVVKPVPIYQGGTMAT